MKQRRAAVHNLWRNLKGMSRNAIKAWIKANKGPFVRHKYLNKLVSRGVETAVRETLRGEERGEEGILLGICGLAFVLTYLESSRLAHSAFRLLLTLQS